MSSCEKTSIVYNTENWKFRGMQPFYYRLRKCNTSLTGFTPAEQYQKLKLIQNTVRVPSSLYVSNLGSLSAYKSAVNTKQGVCWNQMSDRPYPSNQRATVPTGYGNSKNNKHTSVTSSRPGCQTPGGIGCDIKHNSYDRYLNRLKGKGVLRRDSIPENFGIPIKFNPTFPIYGGKTIKTNIVSKCNCPVETTHQKTVAQELQLYNNPLWQKEPTGNCVFKKGDYVYAMKTGTNYYTKAIIVSVDTGIYTIQFKDGINQEATLNELKMYLGSTCDEPLKNDYVYAMKTGTNYYSIARVMSVESYMYTVQFKDGTQQQVPLNELKMYLNSNCHEPLTKTRMNKYISSSGQPISC